MKDDNVLNILMYLFENHIQENRILDLRKKKLLPKLEELGFHRTVIDEAFTWLINLSYTACKPMDLPKKNSFRVFSNYECELLDIECRRFLINLEQQTVLNPHTRELVIHQALELSSKEIDINLLKWVTLMVLFNQSNKKEAFANMELVIDDVLVDGIH